MQLSFDLEVSPLLPRLRERLLRLFGRQRPQARLDPLSQLVKSIIGARTRDVASAAAFGRLQATFKDWGAASQAAPARIEAAIAAVTFADRKARRLPVLLRIIEIRAGALSLDHLAEPPVDAAMDWLRSLPGVGVKSAAATLNFSRLGRRALVVDTHVHRVVRRLGLVGAGSDTDEAYAGLMALVPDTWDGDELFELHWLIKGLGQSICTDAPPQCGLCPLKAECPRIGLGAGRKVVAFDPDRRRGRGALAP